MNRTATPTVDLHALTQAAAALRLRVADEPDRWALRVELAWCLLAGAVYAAGYWNGRAQQSDAADAVAGVTDGDDSVRRLQRECLKHAAFVRYLTQDASERDAAEQVVEVARTLGWEEAWRLSDAAVRRRIGQVGHAALRPR